MSQDIITMAHLSKKKNNLLLNTILFPKTLLLCFIALLPFSILAQSSQEMLEEYTQKYPDSKYIILDKSKNISIDLVDGEIKITESNTEEKFYLNNDFGLAMTDKVYFSSFSEIEEIEAISYAPKKKGFKAQKVEDFKIEDEFSSGIFHDDLKSINFRYPTLQKGSKSSLEYTETTKESRFLGGFYLIEPAPIVKQEYTIEVHPDIEIDFAEFNTENLDFDFQKTKKGNKTLYTWTMNDMSKFDIVDNAPPAKYFIPHIIPRITRYKVDGKKHNLLSNSDDLFNWYQSITQNVNKEADDAALQQLADEITQGATNDLEKVKKIFYWTQNNIKYIAFEEGMNGFVPRNTDQVVNQKYGDCKDMSTCIFTLLEYAGVPASVCWIGTDEIPYTHDEMPTPAIHNHMIAAYKSGDQYYFLDATSEYTPFGMPSSFIQGQEAMIKTGDDAYEIVMVPVVEAEKNKTTDHSTLKIVEDQLIGTSKKVLDGYLKTNLNYRIYDLNEKEEKFRFFSKYLSKGSNKFILEEYDIQNAFDKDKTTEVNYTFNIDDYLYRNENEIFVNLSFREWYKGDKIKDDRDIPIRYKFKQSYNIINELEIPEGYTAEYLPEDLVIEKPWMTFISKYEVKDNKVIHIEEVKENYVQLDKTQFKAFNEALEAIYEATSQTIILKKK